MYQEKVLSFPIAVFISIRRMNCYVILMIIYFIILAILQGHDHLNICEDFCRLLQNIVHLDNYTHIYE